MYQWTSPDTGTTQLSGTPPAWYRGAEQGPRVYVFERGQLVDDTARPVTEEQRLSLRRQAFMAADQDKRTRAESERTARLRLAVEKLLGEKTSDKELEEILQGTPATPPSAGAVSAPDQRQGSPAAGPGPQQTTPSAERLKALVERWENARTEKARRLLRKEAPLSDAPASASAAATDQAASPPPVP